MHFQPRANNTPRDWRCKSSCRKQAGSILPLVTVLIVLVIAFLALTADVMRNVYCSLRLRSGADSAALASFSFYGNAQDNPSGQNAENNMRTVLDRASSAPWNSAPAGPDRQNNVFESGIGFADNDIEFTSNANDGTEKFLKLTARRSGQNALHLFFIPAIFAFSGGSQPADLNKAETYRVTEVVAQPASRIGAGAPREAEGESHAGEFSGYASFPLALSNRQFLTASSPADSTTSYTVDLVSPSNKPALQPGHLRGAFVNVAATGDSGTYYGTGIGAPAVNDLIHLLEYFQTSTTSSYIAPGVVERGSLLQAIDPAAQSFKDREADIKNRLSRLRRPYFYILPVLEFDPFDNLNNNRIVGFAWMQLTNVLDQNGTIKLVFNKGDSMPVRNATHTHGLAHVPRLSGSFLPAPRAPFLDRTSDGEGLSQRGRGLAMAAASSPRPDSVSIRPAAQQ